jgi:hypothetical protein
VNASECAHPGENNMNVRICGSAMAIGLAFSVGAAAQTIEISSPTLGSVVVTPPAIQGTMGGDPGVGAARNVRERSVGEDARRGNGIDLGVRRRSDGSLYDPLDPTQNPATTSTRPSAPVESGAADARGAGARPTRSDNAARPPGGFGTPVAAPRLFVPGSTDAATVANARKASLRSASEKPVANGLVARGNLLASVFGGDRR